MQALTTILRSAPSAGSAAAFKGRVLHVNGNELHVETALGALILHRNSSTRVAHLDSTGPHDLVVSTYGNPGDADSLTGRHVMGRLLVYGGGPGDSQLLCTELFRHDERGGQPVYWHADFWTRALATLADWWLAHALDQQAGGYHTNLLRDGRLPQSAEAEEKWGYVVARTLYAFSTAFALTGDRRYLLAAQSGALFLRQRAGITRRGSVLFQTRMGRHGSPQRAESRHVNIFTQIYTLTGLIAYFDVTCCPATARLIKASLRTLVRCFHDDIYGGFYDAVDIDDLSPEAGLTDSKSFNSIIDPLSATVYLLLNANLASRCFPAVAIVRELCGLILHHFVDPAHNFIREVFRRDWSFAAPSWCNPYNTAFEAGNVGAIAYAIYVEEADSDGLYVGSKRLLRAEPMWLPLDEWASVLIWALTPSTKYSIQVKARTATDVKPRPTRRLPR